VWLEYGGFAVTWCTQECWAWWLGVWWLPHTLKLCIGCSPRGGVQVLWGCHNLYMRSL
jgi:hypothetical protein